MEKRSEINSAIEELSLLVIVKPGGNHETAHIPIKPFLSLCYMVLQVLGGFACLLYLKTWMWCITKHIVFMLDWCSLADKIGPTMAVLRQDVHQNIKVQIKFELSIASVHLKETISAWQFLGSSKFFVSCLIVWGVVFSKHLIAHWSNSWAVEFCVSAEIGNDAWIEPLDEFKFGWNTEIRS